MRLEDVDILEWHRRRSTPPDAARQLARATEHEAAHAIVGNALGLSIGDVHVRGDYTGATEFIAEAKPTKGFAAMLAAPTIWFRMRWHQFPEGDEDGCRRDQQQLAAFDGFTRGEAWSLARDLLREHEDDVLRLAAALRSTHDGRLPFWEWARDHGVKSRSSTGRRLTIR